ncbi:MAG: flagellar hook-length control protein FliK [Thermodesulfobacteriota bacterium]
MTSVFNPFQAGILKNLSSQDNLSADSSKIIKGIVEKNLSLFKFQFDTDVGKFFPESEKVFSKGDLIKFKIAETKNGFFINPAEKNDFKPFKITDETLKSVINNFSQNKTYTGKTEKILSLPKFLVSTDLGKVEIESSSFLKNNDAVKLLLKDVKNAVFEKAINPGSESESVKDALSKLSLKDFSKIMTKDIPELSDRFSQDLKNLSSKEFEAVKNNILKNFIEPQNISSESLKKAVKYFFGSDFEFKNDFKELTELINKYIREQDGKNIKLINELKETVDKGEKFFESTETQKNLNILKFADSSKMYFFLPFTGKDFKSAEFFMDKGEAEGKNKEKGELRAVIKLDMSNLGIVRADLRLRQETDLKIYFGLENEEILKIIKSGFPLLEKNLKKADFKNIYLSAEILKDRFIKESPLKDFIKDEENKTSVFDIIV